MRDAVAAEVTGPYVLKALVDARHGEYRRDGLFWGPFEAFVGMERPLVVVYGFRHPIYLLTKHRGGVLGESGWPPLPGHHTLYIPIEHC